MGLHRETPWQAKGVGAFDYPSIVPLGCRLTGKVVTAPAHYDRITCPVKLQQIQIVGKQPIIKSDGLWLSGFHERHEAPHVVENPIHVAPDSLSAE